MSLLLFSFEMFWAQTFRSLLTCRLEERTLGWGIQKTDPDDAGRGQIITQGCNWHKPQKTSNLQSWKLWKKWRKVFLWALTESSFPPPPPHVCLDLRKASSQFVGCGGSKVGEPTSSTGRCEVWAFLRAREKLHWTRWVRLILKPRPLTLLCYFSPKPEQDESFRSAVVKVHSNREQCPSSVSSSCSEAFWKMLDRGKLVMLLSLVRQMKTFG